MVRVQTTWMSVQKVAAFAAVLLFVATQGLGQSQELKWGKIPEEHLLMTDYPAGMTSSWSSGHFNTRAKPARLNA